MVIVASKVDGGEETKGHYNLLQYYKYNNYCLMIQIIIVRRDKKYLTTMHMSNVQCPMVNGITTQVTAL